MTDKITLKFDDWSDDTCFYNKFYECSHKENEEGDCLICNCPRIQDFYKSDYYEEVKKYDIC